MEPDAPAPVPEGQPRWRPFVMFAAFVLAVLGGAMGVGARHRAVRGADFFTGRYLDVRFTPPDGSARGGSSTVHEVPWPLAQGSGALRVRFEVTRTSASARLITAVRVEPSPSVIDGVEATVRVTGYDRSAVGVDGVERPVGRVTLECIERAPDGTHPHRIELRGDGSSAVLDE